MIENIWIPDKFKLRLYARLPNQQQFSGIEISVYYFNDNWKIDNVA